MLHLTNGDSVCLGDAGVPGEVLVWADVLHEGPVPAGLSLEELSEERGRFLQQPGVFRERDQRLSDFHRHDEVVLWFEHDLFDQLLLIQLLDWFRTQDRGRTKVTCILTAEYLGPMRPERLASLFPTRRIVTAGEFSLAQKAWKVFRSSDPMEMERFLSSDTRALPHLEAAFRRHLQQFPSVHNGLSRTERQILESAACGIHDPAGLFRAHQSLEEAIFLGDTTFFQYIEMLREARFPLLDQNLWVTPTGYQVLTGARDAVRLNGIDRWLGGVHLEGTVVRWRWDERSGRLTELSGP